MKNKIVRSVIIIIFIVGIVIFYFQSQHNTTENQIAEQVVNSQVLLAEMGMARINHIFKMARDELFSAAHSFPLKKLLDAIVKNDVEQIDFWKANLTHLFSGRVETHEFLSQLRFIDSSGMEIVRVNRKDNNIYPAIKLQDKSKEVYFSKAMSMDFNQFYVSPITLNREFGKIEIPHREMIRLAIPVKHNAQKKGIVIMNIDMNAIYKIVDNTSEHAWLFDSSGKLLNCSIGLPQEDHEKLIKLINRQRGDNFSLPLNHYHEKGDRSLAGFYPIEIVDQKWYVVSELPFDEIGNIMSKSNRLKTILFGIITIFLIWLFVDLYKLYANQQKEKLKALMADKLLHLNKQLMQESTELEKANHSLEKMDQRKTDFLNMVAHDLRTPISAILNYSDLLLRYGDNSGKACRDEYAGIIKKESIRLKNLINTYLDVSKIEAGMMEFNHEEFHIKELIDHFVMLYQAEGKSNQITITHEMENDLPYIKCDKERLGQVFSNLFSNAIKFTPSKGYINVKASFIKINDNGFQFPFVQVSIADTGIGIPEDAQSRIFDKFYQASHQNIRQTRGTGLGLAISKAIIEQEGGKIEVESKEGQGTKFTFTLMALWKTAEQSKAHLLQWPNKFSVNDMLHT